MKLNAIKLLTIAMTMAMALSLTGCFGGSASEPTRYFTIGVESINYPQVKNAEYANKRVAVRKFTMDQAYQRTNIVYRESNYQFMFYDLDLWATRPDLMLNKAATEYVKQSGLFELNKTGISAKPDYEILGNVDAIEEIDEGSNRYGRLAMQLSLRKTEGDAPICEREYDEKIALNGNEPQHVAEAISKLLAKYMEDFLGEIAK